MRCAVELSNVHDVALILEDSCLVVVHIEVVGCGEDGHDGGETCCLCFAVHTVAGVLGFVCADDGEEVVAFEELAGGGVAASGVRHGLGVEGERETHVKK